MSSDVILLLRLAICGKSPVLELYETFQFITIYDPIPNNINKSLFFFFTWKLW